MKGTILGWRLGSMKRSDIIHLLLDPDPSTILLLPMPE